MSAGVYPYRQRLGALIAFLIDLKYSTRCEFIAKIYPDKTRGSSSGHLSSIISGKKPLPLEQAELFCDALCLDGKSRTSFLEVALRAHHNEAGVAIFDELFPMKSNVFKGILA